MSFPVIKQTPNQEPLNTPTALAVVFVTTLVASKVDSVFRKGYPIWEYPTSAKMQRTGCYVLGACLPVITNQLTNDPLASIISLLGSVASVFCASQIRDYHDPKECAIMRMEAQHMPFNLIKEKHGLDQLGFFLTISDLQTKFEQGYRSKTFTQILNEYSIDTILRYHLTNLAGAGFLHEKFVEEARDRKLNFILPLHLPDYKDIMSNRMQVELLSLQEDYKKLPKLENIQKELEAKYPDRRSIQLSQYAERAKNIPSLAKNYAKQAAKVEETTREIEQEYIDSLNYLDVKYSQRLEKLNAEYAKRISEVPSLARKHGEVVKNRFLAEVLLGCVQAQSTNRTPQTVQATVRGANRETVGTRNYLDPKNSDHAAMHMAQIAGRDAEQELTRHLLNQLEREQREKLPLATKQELNYFKEKQIVDHSRDVKYQSLRMSEEEFTQKEQKRLKEELDGKLENYRKLGIEQQQKFDQELADSNQAYQIRLTSLEKKLTQILTH